VGKRGGVCVWGGRERNGERKKWKPENLYFSFFIFLAIKLEKQSREDKQLLCFYPVPSSAASPPSSPASRGTSLTRDIASAATAGSPF